MAPKQTSYFAHTSFCIETIIQIPSYTHLVLLILTPGRGSGDSEYSLYYGLDLPSWSLNFGQAEVAQSILCCFGYLFSWSCLSCLSCLTCFSVWPVFPVCPVQPVQAVWTSWPIWPRWPSTGRGFGPLLAHWGDRYVERCISCTFVTPPGGGILICGLLPGLAGFFISTEHQPAYCAIVFFISQHYPIFVHYISSSFSNKGSQAPINL